MPRHALLLAADQYLDPQITRLNYAERDARVQEGFLREVAGFDRVEELYGERLEKSVALDLAREMADRLHAEGGGVLLIFYAGHGFTHLGKHCLLCPKARLSDLDEFDHALTVERLRRATDRPRVERQLVIDACRTVLRAGSRAVAEGYQAAGLRDLAGLAGVPEEAGGFSVLASCDEGEQASEVHALKHGVFALAWMEELRRAQREGRELRVDDGLVKRLRERVAALGREHGLDRPQRPWWRGNADPVVLLPDRGLAPAPSLPPVLPVSGSRLEALQEQARLRAEAARVETVQTARREAEEKAHRRAAFGRLYPVYEALLEHAHVNPEELAEAWQEVCRECGVEAGAAGPGKLAWKEDSLVVLPWVTQASRERPFENSLGMRFVPVKTSMDGRKPVLFSVWQTRVQDYAEYAKETAGVDGSWKDPVFRGVKVTPDPECPVVNVSWEDAKGFCQWLTKRDRSRGLIPPQAYPWGTEWPPKKGAGTYADESAKRVGVGSIGIIEGYEDGYATTSPVGSFAPRPNGLFDLGANVCEWVEEFYDGQSGARALRGGSWYDFDTTFLLSSYRFSVGAGDRFGLIGFRVVLVGAMLF